MKKYLNSFLFISILIVFGCSSIPKRQIPNALLEAQRYLKSAGEAELNLQNKRALNLFEKAYNSFTRIDNLEGKIKAGLGMATIYHRMEDKTNHDLWLNKIKDFAYLNKKDMLPLIKLHEIKIAYETERLKTVLELTRSFPDHSLIWNLESNAYRSLALIKSDQDYETEKKIINSNLGKIEKLFQKNRLEEPELYPFLLYTSGYIATADQSWEEAISLFKDARRADQELANSLGIADDLYALAKCYEILLENELAIDYYQRAREIYCLIADSKNCQECARKLDFLQ